MSKKAVLIGCDYKGTVSELHGAVNDAYAHAQLLVSPARDSISKCFLVLLGNTR